MGQRARLGLIGILAGATLSPPASGNVIVKEGRASCVSPTVRTPDGNCCPPNETYSPACSCCRSLPAIERACISAKAPEKCLEAGEMYDYGRNRDPRRAADMFEKACARGSAIGCVRLAHFFEEGKGRPPDPAQVLRLYDKACAAEKMRCACVVVGVELTQPERTGRDSRRGASLLARACDDGDILACRWLARRYREGRGVERSAEKADALRERACAAKIRDACDGVDPVNPREVIFGSACRPGRISISLSR